MSTKKEEILTKARKLDKLSLYELTQDFSCEELLEDLEEMLEDADEEDLDNILEEIDNSIFK